MFAIYRYGSEEQRQQWLPEMAAGRAIGCFGLTEPDFGSNPAGMRTIAADRGGVWVLNGTKMWITNWPVADTLVVYAKTYRTAGARGITAFIVENTFKGFSTGQKLDKLGMRGSDTSEIVFAECEVPAENVLGEIREESLRLSSLMDELIRDPNASRRAQAMALAADLNQLASELTNATTAKASALIADNARAYASSRSLYVGVAVGAIGLALLLGFVSSFFDNIPLTALALAQGGYDWGVLAYAVGFGGSMLWFGSSAGVAICNMFPEARSTGRWLKEGWLILVAYVAGFIVLIATLGWAPRG